MIGRLDDGVLLRVQSPAQLLPLPGGHARAGRADNPVRRSGAVREGHRCTPWPRSGGSSPPRRRPACVGTGASRDHPRDLHEVVFPTGRPAGRGSAHLRPICPRTDHQPPATGRAGRPPSARGCATGAGDLLFGGLLDEQCRDDDSPTSRISTGPKPRVVMAGVPRRRPEVTVGGRWSPGMLFLLAVIPTRSRSS